MRRMNDRESTSRFVAARRLGWLAALSLSILLSFDAAAQQSQIQGNEAFLQFIRDVEFGARPGIAEQRVFKWQRPMDVALQFTAKTAPSIVAATVGAFDDAQRASGLPTLFSQGSINVIVLMADWKAGDLEKKIDTIAAFYEKNQYQKIEAGNFISFNRRNGHKCGARVVTDRGGSIQGGLIIVDVGDPDTSAVARCSVRAIGSLYGLASLNLADDKSYPSITNKALRDPQLTEYDKRFLHLLYDRSILSGMTSQEALPLFEALVRATPPK